MDKAEVINGDICCEPCRADDKQVKASSYCVDCNECHCLVCKEAHQRFSYMKGHLIVNIEPLLTHRHILRFRKYCTCQIHNKKIEFICSNHDVLCCIKCKQEKHKLCKNIQDIDIIAKEGPSDFLNLKRKADKLKNKTMTLSKYLKETNDTRNNGSETEKLRNTLQDMKEKFLKKMDSFIHDMLERGKCELESKSQDSIKGIKQSEQLIASLGEMTEDIDCWDQTPMTQKFILRHRLTEQLQKSKEKTKVISEKLFIPGKIILSLDNKMESLVNHKFSFGVVYVRDEPVTMDEITDHRAVRIELIHSKNLRRRALDETECVPDITGMSFLDDGRLVVIDKRNRNIRIHDRNSVDIKWTTEYSPSDVVCLEDNRFVVIYQRCLIFYEIEFDDLYSYKKIPTLKKNDTISLKDKSTYIIGVSGDRTPAMMITESGNELDLNLQLLDCSSHHSKCLFYKTTATEFLAISFKELNGIILIDLQTNETKDVQNNELIKPDYMCTGPLDTIFVCCDLGKVVQLTPELSVIAVLRTDVLEPKCIATSKDKKELAIAGNGKILTYKIKQA